MRTTLAGLMLLALLAAPAAAGSISVPGDAPGINAALALAADGDTILIGPGTWVEDVDMDQRSGITLKGAPGAILDNATALPALTIRDCDDITVTGLTFDPTVSDFVGLRIAGSSNVTVSKCSFVRGGYQGLEIGPSGNGDSSDILVTQCRFVGFSGSGIYDRRTEGLVISKCTINDVGGTGITVTDDGDRRRRPALITGNSIVDTGNRGLLISSSGVLATKNSVSLTGMEGIAVDGSTVVEEVRVEKNTVTTTGDAGIRLRGTGNSATGNRVAATWFAGIALDGFACSTAKNKVTWSGTYGIEVTAPGCVVAGDSIAGAGVVETKRRDRPLIPADPTHSGVLAGATGGEYRKVKVKDSAAYGFRVTAAGNLFVGCSAAGSGVFDLFDIAGPGGNTYEKCKFASESIPPP